MNNKEFIKITKRSNSSLDVYIYNNSEFFHDINIFLHGILNIYNINNGFPESIGITLLTSFKESDNSKKITFYTNELPELKEREKEFISKLMIQTFTKGFINYIYEKVKKKTNTKIPSEFIEFLRHIRNGASHNGIFNITNKIKKKAEWRGKKININLHGSDLFKFISIGDVIVILEDLCELEKDI